MNKMILDKLKLEYETTDITINALATKYNVLVKDMKGCNRWQKNLLDPKTPVEVRAHIGTHIEIVADIDPEEIIVDDKLLIAPNPDPNSSMDSFIVKELTEELSMELITQASRDIQQGKPPVLPTELKDSFKKLKKLDKLLQNQAINLVAQIDAHMQAIEVGDTKALRDLAAIHTGLRDSYFNSKNTMISVINGDITQNNNTINNLAGFLAEVQSDC
jgi:hypothetical protein